jgi:uncharacterized protein
MVLDSYAILTLLNDEPGAAAVADLMRSAIDGEAALFLNEINVGEVYYIVARHRSAAAADRVLDHLETLPLERVSNDYAAVLDAARVKARHRLSYADAFVVATAARLRATVVTGDREFASVEEMVDVRWI